MTLSTDGAINIIKTVNYLIGENNLMKIIDQPVVNTTDIFLFSPIGKYSYSLFCRTIHDYIVELNKNVGFVKCSILDNSNDMITVLDHLYDGKSYHGFDGALLDASNANYDGIKLVIERLSITMKTYLRNKYMKWVVFRYIDSLSWNDKCMVASVLLQIYHKTFPSQIQGWPIERVAGKLFSLMQNCFGSMDLSEAIQSNIKDHVKS